MPKLFHTYVLKTLNCCTSEFLLPYFPSLPVHGPSPL